MKNIEGLPHGHESYVSYYGEYVLKRPLPRLGNVARLKWLEKQHRTKRITDEIRAVGNPTYNIPEMHFVNDDDYQVLEVCAPGEPLKPELYNKLSKRQKYEIITSLASFLVDMNELKTAGVVQPYNLSPELAAKHRTRLDNFISDRMAKCFDAADVDYVVHVVDLLDKFEFESCRAWSHCDLSSGNVLYDVDKSKLWIIDFAEADYHFIYHDIFSPVAVDLDICRPVYEMYSRYHDRGKFQLPGVKNDAIRDIMKMRSLLVCMNRFEKCVGDVHLNTTNENGIKNNMAKIKRMHDIIARMKRLEMTK